MKRKAGTAALTRREKVSLFLLKIATYIQLLIWLNFFEAMTYARSSMGMWQIVLSFLILTVGAIKLVAVQLATGSPSEKRWLKGFILLISVNIYFGYKIEDPPYSGGISPYDIDLKAYVHQGTPLPDGVELIYKDVPKDIYIFGKDTKSVKRYYWLNTSGNDPLNYALINPEFFEEYSKTLEFDFSDEYMCAEDKWDKQCDQIRFFELFMPGYRFTILTNSDPAVPIKDSYSYISFERDGNNKQYTFFQEIINGELDHRLRRYWRFLRNTFNSSSYRTTYKNDPYLLIWQGKYEEAQAGFDELSPERRAICEKYLAKRLEKEATLIREEPVKSAIGEIDFKLVYPQVSKYNYNSRYHIDKPLNRLKVVKVGDTLQIDAEVKVNYGSNVKIYLYDIYRKYPDPSSILFEPELEGRPLDTLQALVSNDRISVKWKVPASNLWGLGELSDKDIIYKLRFYCKLEHPEIQGKSGELRYDGEPLLVALDSLTMEPIPFLPYTYTEYKERKGTFDAQGSTTEDLNEYYLKFEYEPAPILRYKLIEPKN